MQSNPQHQSVSNWITSSRLYEDNLFYYSLIIVAWFFVGFFTLGFELTGLTLKQSLIFNFVWFLVLCIAMSLAPFWYRLLFGKSHNQKRVTAIKQEVNKIKDYDERQAVLEYLASSGQLPIRPTQTWALVFLGCYCLFEIFFITAWVKDMALVWEPRWASMLIEWVRANTDFVSDEGVNHQLFWVIIKPAYVELYQLYASEREFLASDFGGATALFQVFRAFLGFPLSLLSLAVIIWRPLDWLGFSRIDPRNIRSARAFIFASITTLVMTFFLLSDSTTKCNV